jgi:diguanylate cyclase (GGDEF)-like protein
MAMLDALTGLLNRRAFETQAEQAISRARRDGTGLAALMLDLDHFKRINDQYGHPAGDAVIKFTADVLAASVRDTDLVARVGGEEFMVLLPGTSPQAALEVAEKIRQRVMHTPQAVNATEHVDSSVSVGVACFAPGKMCSFEKLYAQADQALYEAKRLGRNRVVQSDRVLKPACPPSISSHWSGLWQRQPPAGHDVAQQVGSVGHDAVHAHVHHLRHAGGFVHCPGQHGQAQGFGLLHQLGIQIAMER